jgi:hypothetical protein
MMMMALVGNVGDNPFLNGVCATSVGSQMAECVLATIMLHNNR